MGVWSWLERILLGRRAGTGVSPFATGGGPARLLVLRHAEKTGDPKDTHLSGRGWKRAKWLASHIPEKFGRPDFLVAASRSKRSNRPYETLEPLAKALGISILDTLDDEDFDGVVAALGAQNFAGRLGVVSWRHSDIPDLLAALGAPEGTYPDDWDEAEYDLLIEIDYRARGVPAVHRHAQGF